MPRPEERALSVESGPDFFEQAIDCVQSLILIGATDLRPNHHKVHSQDIPIPGQLVRDFRDASDDDSFLNGSLHGFGDDFGRSGFRAFRVLAILGFQSSEDTIFRCIIIADEDRSHDGNNGLVMRKFGRKGLSVDLQILLDLREALHGRGQVGQAPASRLLQPFRAECCDGQGRMGFLMGRSQLLW